MNTVLIVDDEAGIREILSRWLAAEGYEIREAGTAEDALENLAAQRSDVVMCDIEMPGQGGVWLAGVLRERYPTAAIVLGTALDSVPPTTSLQSGIVEYLVKPFDRASVICAVQRGVTWHAEAAERLCRPGKPRESIAACSSRHSTRKAERAARRPTPPR